MLSTLLCKQNNQNKFMMANDRMHGGADTTNWLGPLALPFFGASFLAKHLHDCHRYCINNICTTEIRMLNF